MQYKKKIIENLYKISSPERYTGNEWNSINKEWQPARLKVALAFPDVYEIGMSHLGLKILYHLINREENMLAERVYAPWQDMEDLMKEEEIPLYTLESYHEIKDFDVLGFTLQYEMSYTNILNMLDLSGLSIYASEREEDDPLIIAGGSTVFNSEPIADFIDLFFVGEAESFIIDLLNDIEGFITTEPEGAFYVFPNVSHFFGKTIKDHKIENATDFSMFLLEEALVATVTGDAFGNPDCIRISYAASESQIEEALKRIKSVLAEA